MVNWVNGLVAFVSAEDVARWPSIAGLSVKWVAKLVLMVFVQVVNFRLVEVSVLFLGLSSLFRELRCGV